MDDGFNRARETFVEDVKAAGLDRDAWLDGEVDSASMQELDACMKEIDAPRKLTQSDIWRECRKSTVLLSYKMDEKQLYEAVP